MLLVLLVVTVLPYGTVEVWSTAIWELVILFITLLWGLQAVINKRLQIELNPLVWPLVALMLIAFVQLIPMLSGERKTITYHSFATLDAAVKVFVLILFFLLFATFVHTPERRQQVVTTIILLSVGIALIGIGQTYGKLIWPRATFGPFVNRNHFAGFLEMAAGLIGARLVSRTLRRERMVLYVCFMIIVSSGLILSASRGGYLSLAAVILFLALVSLTMRGSQSDRAEGGRGLQLRLAAALILLVVMSFGAMFLTSSDELLQRFGQVENDLQMSELADQRYSRRELWQTTLQMVKDHPLLGVGLGAYQYAYTRYDQGSGVSRVEQAHNDYLQIIADTGVIGGLVMLAFLALLFVRSFKAMQTRDLLQRSITLGALAGCFGIAVHSFVEFNLQVTTNAQLFLALAVLATTKVTVEEPTTQPASKEMVYTFH
ncbi:MAG TPA: O-antigen ligase family protein [Blastocatellia bacterium]|nr:O-antigen ligase family protein [Blastocatellia bacterium]